MKNNLFSYFIIFLLGIVAMYLMMKSCEEKKQVDYSGQVAELVADTTRMARAHDSLLVVIDSLEQIPREITKVVYKKIKDSDSLVAKDSSNAIPYFREGLQLWGWIPEGTDYPTFRELKLGGDIAQEGFGFKLQVKWYDEEYIPTLKKLVDDNYGLYETARDLLVIKDLTNQDLTKQLEKERKWYHSDLMWFGAGAVGAGILVFLLK